VSLVTGERSGAGRLEHTDAVELASELGELPGGHEDDVSLLGVEEEVLGAVAAAMVADATDHVDLVVPFRELVEVVDVSRARAVYN
jgi:hypothetical protein